MTNPNNPEETPIGDQAEEWLAEQAAEQTPSDAPSPKEAEAGEGMDGEDAPADSAPDPLETAQARIAELEDLLARAQADTYNVQQEYNNYVRRTKGEIPTHRQNGQAEVVEALLPALDDVHAAREHGQLEEGPFAAIVKKIEEALANRMNLEIYGGVGELFDPNLHEALMAEPSDEVEETTIVQVLQPGYRIGDRILRPARVIVHNPA
ncbi:nucleotide exchange factor GrpE [Boudabousia marimammalium]|uniref:Protein GrpE n=1 Tax=Boudabousia marimammalium TaxID=156892 RepID=A0A1Q5PMD2_9ACTO|nr:nucleotide exchange factor GrpE [Boudabousia marimammalium]OKL48718.1 nucleotide exchange factor GrpE [Boudabousia marimammalium]